MTVLRSVYVGVLVSALALVLSATPSAARTDARLEEAAALESRALSLVREGKLVCVSCSPQGLVLGALDAVTFRHPTRPLPKVVFTVEGGKAQSFLLSSGGRESTWRRVPDEAPKEKP